MKPDVGCGFRAFKNARETKVTRDIFSIRFNTNTYFPVESALD